MRVEKGMTRKKRHPLVIPAPPFVITKVPPVIPAEAGIQVPGRTGWIRAAHIRKDKFTPTEAGEGMIVPGLS